MRSGCKGSGGKACSDILQGVMQLHMQCTGCSQCVDRMQAAEADGGGGHGGRAPEVHCALGRELPRLLLPPAAAHHADAQRLPGRAAHAGPQAVRRNFHLSCSRAALYLPVSHPRIGCILSVPRPRSHVLCASTHHADAQRLPGCAPHAGPQAMRRRSFWLAARELAESPELWVMLHICLPYWLRSR